MPRRRNRLNWLYDNDLQQFTTPCGQVVTLLHIAQMLQDHVTCSLDLAGPWMGWRIRQNRLIAPGETFRTSRITATNIRAFSRWLASYQGEQAQLPLDTNQTAQVAPHQYDIASHSHSQQTATPETASQQNAPQPPEHEPRRRAEVIQLAAYRKRVRVR